MSIQVIWEKLKRVALREELLLSALILVVSSVSFLLGRFSVSQNVGSIPEISEPTQTATPVVINQIDATVTPDLVGSSSVEQNTGGAKEGGYVASKSGTKYHLPWCSGAKRIKEENKVWFKTKEEAEAAGYEPAANCKGI